MAESEQKIIPPKKNQSEKKALTNGITNLINPMLKDLNSEDNVLQMPELALRCSQFFQSISQYCLVYYKNFKRDQETNKTKLIKKGQKDKKDKDAIRKHKKRMEEDGQNDHNNSTILEPPKKPLTAYIIYFQDKKPMFVQRYPSLNLSELTKLIAKEWKELSDSEKKVYLDRASQDRKRYDEQITEFKRMYEKKYGQGLGSVDIPYQQNIQEQQFINIEEIQAKDQQKKHGMKAEEPQAQVESGSDQPKQNSSNQAMVDVDSSDSNK